MFEVVDTKNHIMSNGYPSDWDSRRKKVYKRDDYICQNCGGKGGQNGPAELHAHHIVPKSNGGSHELSNLQTVCNDCHKAIHGDSTAPTGSSGTAGVDFADMPFTIQAGFGLGCILGLYLVQGMGAFALVVWPLIVLVCFLSSAVVWGLIFGDRE